MKIKYGSIPKKILTLLKDIGQTAQSNGLNAYLVGGAVRDLILRGLSPDGDCPLQDYDVMVEGNGIDFAKTYATKNNVELKTYDQFGTATLIFSDDLKIDIASARSETYSTPGALPTVSSGELYDDMFRRDFTINATAMSIRPDQIGQLYDPFAGHVDIEAKQLRVMHAKSFIDDPTRIMRLIRYQSRFGFKIEPATLGLLVEALENNVMTTISQSRFFKEFTLLLNEPKVNVALKQFNEFGLNQYLPFDIKVTDTFSLKKRKMCLSPLWVQALGQLMSHLSAEEIHLILGKVNVAKKTRQEIIEHDKNLN